jgi:hypothetical protein
MATTSLSKTEGRTRTTVAPLLLTPSKVKNMIDARRQHQVIKFRTTVADCVPNL